jgi:hypothetical protein
MLGIVAEHNALLHRANIWHRGVRYLLVAEPHRDGWPHLHGFWWAADATRVSDWREPKEWWWERVGKAAFYPFAEVDMELALGYCLKYALKRGRRPVWQTMNVVGQRSDSGPDVERRLDRVVASLVDERERLVTDGEA